MEVIVRIVVAVLLAAGVAAAGAWLVLPKSLPQIDGTVKAKGLGAPVKVLRDAEGVPHLFAASERDGWFAMGYVHAQDRLWQMELQRRVASGRLAEFLGERGFETDRLMRTLGIARVAERIVARLDARTREAIQAYADGINAFVASDPVLPVEFQVFRLEPEAWKPADTVGWLLVMAWDLSGNWKSELTRVRFAARLGAARAAEILSPLAADGAPALPDFKALYAELDGDARELLARSPYHEEAVGSNSWVVSGRRAAGGKPLLANDPHLGLQAPALWYLAHLSTPAGNVVGGTLPGVPFVVLGRNDRVAWSMTTTNGDTQDLFVERLVPGDPGSYLTPQGRAKFESREEVIRVGGEERRIRVRASRHGPVISDVLKPAAAATPKGHAIALSWAALSEDNATVRAGLAMNRARNRDEFLAAAREFHAPQQNVAYADADGRIGFVAAGRVPVRRPDNEAMGRVPVPGWEAKYDWQGFLAFESLPAVHDPKSGQVVTANNRITPPGYRPFISSDWMPPYRAERIESLLGAGSHTRESFAKMQADVRSRLAAELLPVMLRTPPRTDIGRAVQELVRGWNGEMVADSAAPLAFAAWYRELTRLVYHDELGPLFLDAWEMRAPFMIAVMKGQGGLERWCDDTKTPEKESCMAMSALALEFAYVELKDRYGGVGGTRWGTAHAAAGDHRPFGFVPQVGRIFNVSPETPGDTYSLNVGHFHLKDEARPFANRHAASLRMVHDLADPDRSLYMISTGQSGNRLSPWYASFAERWARVEYVAIPTRREAIAAAHTLELSP